MKIKKHDLSNVTIRQYYCSIILLDIKFEPQLLPKKKITLRKKRHCTVIVKSIHFSFHSEYKMINKQII